jgi:enediyne polyketide synthase
MSRIAVLGMACRYPDAASPTELWENVLAGRRAFRRFPDVRMRLEDYWDADPSAPDRFYARNAAVIDGYAFDRVAHKIAGSTYRATDLTHWLALDMAGRALQDAGFPQAEGLPRERTGVVVGNTLTGEFVRANQMRLRWPYVRRTLAGLLREQGGWDDERLAAFLTELEVRYKSPFPPIDEDSLAGGLSNTIAGRICNYFDFKGGGYTIDGACSSSLLSVATACKALLDNEIDVAVAGGVDLSLDPFELVGFAKTGALARGEMRVYDRASNGFWPGEGCGMIVLMREADAVALNRRIYATVAGWGISSDGKGGMTRPEIRGYRLALHRAYERAGFGIDTVPLFEGHGTGTPVGDVVELTALSQARTAANANAGAAPAAIGTIKAMIGHTKAAAGVAGLIKAVMALHRQALPPTTGCFDPHPVLTQEGAALRVLRKAEPWPADAPLRAGVTAMGFGGINTHIVLEGSAPRRASLDLPTRALASSVQDAELLLIDAGSVPELRNRLTELADWIAGVSYAQLADVAATARRGLRDLPCRAAVVVSTPQDARRRLLEVLDSADAGHGSLIGPEGRSFLGYATGAARIGYLFPGQGSGRGTSGGALRRRLAEVEEVYAAAALPAGGDMAATAVAQPRIVTGSMAGLRALASLGLQATLAVGHSLGELSALHWAGVLDEQALLRIAAVRGATMAEHSASGTMAGISAPPETVAALIHGLPVVIASYNGPGQTVIAGPVEAVESAGRRAGQAELQWIRLSVSHAFHSPLVKPAADAFAGWLGQQDFRPVERRVISTVTGEALPPDTDIAALLRRQITDPVLFAQAVQLAAKDVDLFVEVGPGRVLTGLAQAIGGPPAVALDTDDESLTPLLQVAAAAFVAGAPLDHEMLFRGRLTRPLEIGAEWSFLASPCEQAPDVTLSIAPAGTAPEREGEQDRPAGAGRTDEPTIEVLRRLAAERVELPPEMVADDSRLLDDLHLSSITVGQLVNQAALLLDVTPTQTPTSFATATLRELADTLDLLAETGGGGAAAPIVEGAAAWARPYWIDNVETPLPGPVPVRESGLWQVYAPVASPLAEPLRQALQQAGLGAGFLVCLPPDCTEQDLDLALRGVQAAVNAAADTRFVLVQTGRGAAGLAKTLRLEAPHLHITVAHVPPVADAVGWVVAEVAATTGFSEAIYDRDGVRRVPTLRVLPVRAARTEHPLSGDDVLLVTGGGKGITAECALVVARDSGARLAIMGRSDPADDAELAANLRRMAEGGAGVTYVRADVTDAGQVREAIAEVEQTFGQVTAILHGAGRNEPAALTHLDMAAIRQTIAPKIDGLQAVLEAVDPDKLRLLVTFGSIIGRSGLPGEGHYAVANEWLAALTQAVGEWNPHCRCLCMEWSVWSGVGMGERLSVVESLARDGITPISPDQGLQVMRRLVADPDAPAVAVISGRTGSIDTIRREAPQLPLLRFVGHPLIRYHGAELVTEVDLNTGTDLYLADHLLDGNLLFPAVFGMEAMAQVALATTGAAGLPVIEDAEFLRPVVVPPDGSMTVRIAAVVTGDDCVDVAIRSAETGFAADHFRARLRFAGGTAPDGPPGQVGDDMPLVPLDPAIDLYGSVLFQGGRFHRLRNYHRAAARHVDADVAVADGDWFAGFLPGRLLLGDPGMRDALMHGNQVCVPDATLLPIGIERLYPMGELPAAVGHLRYCATERRQDGDTYTYDIAVRTPEGQVVERWEGLRLQAVRKTGGRGPWLAPLLSSYLERTVQELLGTRVAVGVEPVTEPFVEPAEGTSGEDFAQWRRRRSALAAARALGRRVTIRYRPDGRPELEGTAAISCAHGRDLTVCVAAPGLVGCDVEAVTARPASVWQGLLGTHMPLADLIVAETADDLDIAATRVWAAVESLQKAGLPPGAPLVMVPPQRDGWAVFSSAALHIATFVTTLRDHPDPVVFAIFAQEGRS